MFSQAVTTIQNFIGRKNRPSFGNYLADLGNFQDSEDLLDLGGRVDEPNPRHWQKLGLAASFPT